MDRRHVGLAAAASLVGAGYLAYRRPWLRQGATDAETTKPLPGDELIPDVLFQATRATTLNASPEQVWPWLVQMGHGRAGWYSLDKWDNAGELSATRIIPELQHLAVGDRISDATGPFSFTVARLEAPRVLVFRATIHPVTGRPVDPAHVDPNAHGYAAAFLDFTWAFVLEPLDAGQRTRLVVRVRYRHQRSRWMRAMLHGYEIADAIFAPRMFAGLKARCERDAAA